MPRYLILLESTPGDAPPIIRLRHLLKAALRQYGLRCAEAEEVPEEPIEPVTRHARGRRIDLDAPTPAR